MAVTQRTSRRAAPAPAAAAVSTASSAAVSAAGSPSDSPKSSRSNTSLSSLASEGEAAAAVGKTTAPLVDLYGQPFALPDFTIKQIRDAIPAHCYERSAVRGLAYVARDFFYLGTTFYLFYTYATPEYVPSVAARTALWALYTVLQGLFATGVWVLAHECGHGAFSPSRRLNDAVGWVLHSALLVPYFSWKISHGKHHKATGHMERDMVHVPKTREQYASLVGRLAHELPELAEDTPLSTLIHLVTQQLGGWPVYIMTNVTGHNFHERQPEGRGRGKRNGPGGGVNHFDPRSPLYEQKDAHLILWSDLGIALAIAGLTALGLRFGWANLAVWYGVPYLWVNHWLVMITFLQHTDPSLPHYGPEQWTFARGAAATIDREFGFVGRHLLHGIVETHVLHHFVSSIPFYNADEATAAIRPVMGGHYRADVRGGPLGFLTALWRNMRWCVWVEPPAADPAAGVYFYRNKNGLGLPPAPLAPVA